MVAGISHHGASLDVREKIAYRSSELTPTIEALRELTHAAEGVLLSTCNRTEFYVVENDASTADHVWRMLGERLGADATGYGYVHRDAEAVAHLFRVSSGLDSMVLGEAQIPGQVKAAWENCRPTSGVVLNRLFQTALLVGGRVRHETALGRGAASVSSASVQLAKQIFGSLAGRRAMILGAGEMAELALECFVNEGVRAAIVANRTIARAEVLAEKFGARAMGYEECWASLADVDLLVSSTAAPVPVVTMSRVTPSLKSRGDRPLCIIDIAVPRDVEPAVRELDNVFLYDLDDLQALIAANMERRRAELPTAEHVIAEETQRFWEWVATLDVVPTLTRFRGEIEELRQREVAEALRKMGDLSPSQREQVEHLSRALTNKFLHGPTVRLRQAATNGRGPGVIDALRYLFGLDDARGSAHSGPRDGKAGPDVHEDR